MREFRISDGQFHFNRSLKGLGIAAVILLVCVVFSPLLALGYYIDTRFISLHAPGHVWLVAVLGTAFVLYLLLFLGKAFLIGLYRKHSGWWIPLFIFCVALTCILPALIAYPIFNFLTDHTQPVTWILDIAFVYFVYGQYNFLNQKLPFFGRP